MSDQPTEYSTPTETPLPQTDPPPKAPIKIAILGSAEHIFEAPWDDPSWIKWGLPWCHPLDKCQAWFDPHAWDEIDLRVGQGKVADLAALQAPIVMQAHFAPIPNSVEYPRGLVAQKVPVYVGIDKTTGAFTCFHQSTIGYEIAYALACINDEQGNHVLPDAIGVWGVDMLHDSEYAHQKGNVEALLGYALGLGVQVVLPKGSALLRSDYAYGYDDWPTEGVFSERYWIERQQKMTAMEQEAVQRLATIRGAVQELSHEQAKWKHGLRGGHLSG